MAPRTKTPKVKIPKTPKVKSKKDEAAASRAKFRASKEWKEWRLKVIARDDSKCQCCGRKYPSKSLQCHHKSMEKEKYQTLDDLNEFVSLCSICHKTLHQFEIKVHSKKQVFSGKPQIAELVESFFI